LDTLGHSKKALSKKSENMSGAMKMGKIINMGGDCSLGPLARASCLYPQERLHAAANVLFLARSVSEGDHEPTSHQKNDREARNEAVSKVSPQF
jgi:hypothetical protein